PHHRGRGKRRRGTGGSAGSELEGARRFQREKNRNAAARQHAGHFVPRVAQELRSSAATRRCCRRKIPISFRFFSRRKSTPYGRLSHGYRGLKTKPAAGCWLRSPIPRRRYSYRAGSFSIKSATATINSDS